MATLASLTLDVLEMLYGVAQIERPVEDTLKTAVASAVDTTFRFYHPSLWKQGDYAEFWAAGTEGEILIMAEDHPAAGDVIVRRGQRGTTASALYAVGDVFFHNPPFPVATIQRWINNVIDVELAPHVFYLSQRIITVAEYDTNHTAYPLTAGDFDVVSVYQADLSSADTISGCTFASIGALWTSAAHGLSVGDHLVATTAGNNPVEYTEDTHYWVLTVPSVNTFTLGITANAATALAGAADSTTAWTFEKRGFSHHPFPRGYWDVLPHYSTTLVSTGSRLRLYTVHDDDEPIYYIAKTRPSSAAITSLPTDIVEMIPWAVCAKLIMGTRAEPRRMDLTSLATAQDEAETSVSYGYMAFMAEFMRLRRQYRMKIQRELGQEQQRTYRSRHPRRG